MWEVVLIVLASLFLYIFNIFLTGELKMPFFHSRVVNPSEMQEAGNLSMKSGHLEAVLRTVTIQLSNWCHLATRSRLGQEVKMKAQWRSIIPTRKFKCILSTVGWECGGSRQRCINPRAQSGSRRVLRKFWGREWVKAHAPHCGKGVTVTKHGSRKVGSPATLVIWLGRNGYQHWCTFKIWLVHLVCPSVWGLSPEIRWTFFWSAGKYFFKTWNGNLRPHNIGLGLNGS